MYDRPRPCFDQKCYRWQSVQRFLFAFGWISVLSVHQVDACAQDRNWKEGKELTQQLDAVVSVQWSGVPLRQALMNLATAQHVAIWLDRRVNPDQQIEFAAQRVSLDILLQKLTSQLGLGSCRVDSILYVGPPETTEWLSTVAAVNRQKVQQANSAVSRRLLAKSPWRFPQLTPPAELLQEIARTASVNIVGARYMPHDLWPAYDLPPVSLIDRVTLLLAGFGKTVDVAADAATLTIVNMPEQAIYHEVYPTKSSAAAVTTQLRKSFPDVNIETQTGRIRVSGKYEDHLLIQRLLAGEQISRTSVVPGGQQRYDLNIENQPFAGVARALGKSLGFTTTNLDSKLEPVFGELISFQVKQVSRDVLLQTLADTVNADFRVDGATLTFFPK